MTHHLPALVHNQITIDLGHDVAVTHQPAGGQYFVFWTCFDKLTGKTWYAVMDDYGNLEEVRYGRKARIADWQASRP
jgi:hypothetical protein